MALLTPSESHAFQSFLSSIDALSDSVGPEWSMFTPDDVDIPIPHIQGKEALVKATKDLMALDDDRWKGNSISRSSAAYNPQATDSQYLSLHQHQHQHQQLQYTLQQSQDSQRPNRHIHDHFPFLSNKQQSQSQPYSIQPYQQTSNLNLHVPHPIAIAPLHTLGNAHPSSRNASSITPSSPVSASISASTSQLPVPTPPPKSPSLPPLRSSPQETHNLPSPRPKRALEQEQSASSSSSNKRSKTSSPSNPPAPIQSNSQPPQSSNQSPQAESDSHSQQKQSLLSPSQKKANHIQSEQKRRANIRRGYETLCETVPALREAIREEEEELLRAGASAAAAPAVGGKNGKRKGRGKGKDVDGEKIDGRAGPRSENIVLAKTIDYINDLLSERTALLARLNRAKASLPPGHPALTPGHTYGDDPHREALWERKWKGGEGKLGGEDEGEDDEDDS